MASTKVHERQIISSYSQIESCMVNISSTANTTYYLNLCNINNYFNNFNTKLTFELNFLRSSGGAISYDNITKKITMTFPTIPAATGSVYKTITFASDSIIPISTDTLTTSYIKA